SEILHLLLRCGAAVEFIEPVGQALEPLAHLHGSEGRWVSGSRWFSAWFNGRPQILLDLRQSFVDRLKLTGTIAFAVGRHFLLLSWKRGCEFASQPWTRANSKIGCHLLMRPAYFQPWHFARRFHRGDS